MSKLEKSSNGKSLNDPPMEELVIGSVAYQTRLTSKFLNRKTWSRPDERKIEAFIPGNILKLFIKEGSEVTPGTPLLILEAMKMSNELLSPIEGTIKKIYVSEGDMVAKSQLLFEFK